MIRLKPTMDLLRQCPGCGRQLRAVQWLITGMHSMSYMECTACSRTFYAEMPVNAGLFYPGILDARTGNRCDDMPFNNWYLHGLTEAFKKRKPQKVPLEVIRKRELGP